MAVDTYNQHLTEAMHGMRKAMKELYDRVVGDAKDAAPASAHFVALEMLDRTYHAIVADFEARRFDEPPQVN